MKIKKTIIWILCFITVLLPNSIAAQLPKELIPGGHTFGVKIFTEGVLVVGVTPASSEDGSAVGDSSLSVGDVIVKVEGKDIISGISLQEAVQESLGKPLNITVKRDGKEKKITVKPVETQEGWRLGVWVRDSMAGIGTLTFYDPETNMFGALGHGINDVDTGQLMLISSGSIVPSVITQVKPGQFGAPGELKGSFDIENETGQLSANTEYGIFGQLKDTSVLGKMKPLPVASAKEIIEGPAVIYSNVEGDKVEEYTIEITKIYHNFNGARNFMIQVKDPKLINITGGIVQGMSGSPIIQNGKLIGAVTHVLVNDPRRGYGVFIETMFEEGLKSRKESAPAA